MASICSWFSSTSSLLRFQVRIEVRAAACITVFLVKMAHLMYTFAVCWAYLSMTLIVYYNSTNPKHLEIYADTLGTDHFSNFLGSISLNLSIDPCLRLGKSSRKIMHSWFWPHSPRHPAVSYSSRRHDQTSKEIQRGVTLAIIYFLLL